MGEDDDEGDADGDGVDEAGKPLLMAMIMTRNVMLMKRVMISLTRRKMT